MKSLLIVLYHCLILTLFLPAAAHAQDGDLDNRLRQLEAAVQGLQQEVEQRDARIEQLENRLGSMRGGTPVDSAADTEAKALLRELAEPGQTSTRSRASDDLWRLQMTDDTAFRLIDLSAVVNLALGTSSEYGHELEELQGGAHDPRNRGFTFQQLELSLAGAVDPYFYGEAHIIFSEHGAELEEAFAQTTSLPHGLQVKAGYYLTEFGRINASHPHTWAWLDQPVINTRLFGPEGMRGPGARVSWLTPLPWYSEIGFGAQQSTGDYMVSFNGGGLGHDHGHEEEDEDEDEEHHGASGVGGWPVEDVDTRSLNDLVYSARWQNGLDLSDTLSTQFGLSGLYGANNTGSDGYTFIYGTDVVLKYDPVGNSLQRPLWSWQTELMNRDYHADGFVDDDEFIAGDTLSDWGLYTQLLYSASRNWSLGLRYEYASSSGDNVHGHEREDAAEDPLRNERHRISPLVMYHPTEFSRLRLQYNYDDAEHLEEGDAHSIWLGLEILFGSHPAHTY